MLEYKVEPGESLLLAIQAPDVTYTTLYPRGNIYNSAGSAVVTNLDFTHAANGLYLYNWTENLGEGRYRLQTLFYTDAAHTILADVIQPDSDGIDVCHYKYRPSFMGGSSDSQVVKVGLTEEEFDNLVERIYKKLLPELNKKSEFNVKKDEVKVDLSKVDSLEKFLINRLNNLENSIPDNSKVLSEIGKIKPQSLKPIIDLINVMKSSVIKECNPMFLMDTLTGIVKKIEEIDVGKDIKMIDDKIVNFNKNINKSISSVSPIDYTEKFNSILKKIEEIKNIKTEDDEQIDIDDIEEMLKEYNQLMIDKLVEKDKIDNKRIKVLLQAIQSGFSEIAKNTDNSGLKEGMMYILNNLEFSKNED